MAPSEKLKRKDPPVKSQDGDAKSRAKRQKIAEAREIRTQTSHTALNERKELDVASFVKSHEFEIQALETSITSSKSALARRAFQQVPRQLRRRTASHNVKKVPKRLRARARREMKEDNTPTVNSHTRQLSGKQRLRAAIAKAGRIDTGEAAQTTKDAKDPQGGQESEMGAPILVKKFRKRQLNKSWLPTHMYHTKRAHMTPPLKPLWRFAIPLTPTEKVYRQTHRACTLRGCVAWDMSYMNSFQLTGREDSLVKLLRCLSVLETQLTGRLSAKWIHGTRAWSGWVYERDNSKLPIAPVTIIWSPSQLTAEERQLIIRAHPSAFSQLWQELLKLAKMQRPKIRVQDLRFELGSIEISGPEATQALVQVLRPMESNSSALKNWESLAAVTNTESLPSGAVVGFSMADPRLQQPLQRVSSSASNIDDELLDLLVDWPPKSEQEPFTLLNQEFRERSSQQLLSQKTINRRKSNVLAGEHPPNLPTDPSIPVVLYTAQQDSAKGSSSSWIVLLPWKYVLPTWYCLMHVPLSSGGQPRFGGLQEQRQLFFEKGTPWFPGDYPGTKSGWAWELHEREQRKADWMKRPKSKRTQFDSLDLGPEQKGEAGLGWACDWEFLCGAVQEGRDNLEASAPASDVDVNSNISPPDDMQQYPASSTSLSNPPSPRALAAVSLRFLNRGHASNCARIYRLPTDIDLRAAWLALAPQKPAPKLRNDSMAAPRRLVSHSYPEPGEQPTPLTAADRAYPHVPTAGDLVGFVTTGNYNLGQGQATAVGNILVARIIEDTETNRNEGRLSGLCIIRDAGVTVGRLARWEVCA